MIKIVWKKAEKKQDRINEKTVEECLSVLNQSSEHPVFRVLDVVVLNFNGHDYFFVDGATIHATTSLRPYAGIQRAFFLIAVGQQAVRVLSEQDHLFQRISGSEELAVFSIYDWSGFTKALIRKGK